MLLATGAGDDSLALGDALYARRAEGAQGARAAPARVDEAIAAYRRALAASPEARPRLLKALFFRGSFCGATLEERRRLFEEARDVGEAGLRGPGQGGAALRLWTAIAWGEWALARGKFAAARQGAAGRI